MNVTRLNLSVLDRIFGEETTVRNLMAPTSYRHVQRCFKAGLITVTPDTMTLTDAGIAALAAYRSSK